MIYTVQRGDTLGQIATAHRTSIENLMRLNPDITDKDRIHVGQQIRITAPTPQPQPRTHRIAAGDTFWGLSRQYNTTVADLQRLNPGVDPNSLQRGQVVNIPSATPSPTPSPAPAPPKVDIIKFYRDRRWRVTSPYGMRPDPFTGQRVMHHGTDFAGQPAGHPIHSPVDGVVVRAQSYSGYGNTVVVECARGLWHILAHAQRLLVKVGQRVVAGETVLSLNGMTGTATGPHIHYQINPKGSVRSVEAVMDPAAY